MKKLLLFCLGIFILAGCSKPNAGLKLPPSMQVVIESKSYDTLLGTYCWTNECVDKVGAVELLKDEPTIQVKPGQVVQLKMQKEYLPQTSELFETYKGKEKNHIISNMKFTAPSQKGIYYYTFSSYWDGSGKSKLDGDAVYVFALEIS